MASNRGSHGRVENSATSKATPTGSHLMDHQWARVPAGFFLHFADILTRVHRHACIEVYNVPMTSDAVEITIIITISVLLYACVVIIGIHACLCLALLLWPQKHPQNRSFRVGLHKEVRLAIPKAEVHCFLLPPIPASLTGGRHLVMLKKRLKREISTLATYLLLPSAMSGSD